MAAIENVSDFEQLLSELTGFKAPLDNKVSEAVKELLIRSPTALTLDRKTISRRFYGRVNAKLDANRQVRASLYNQAAEEGITFNYPQKKLIARAIDESRLEDLTDVLARAGVSEALRHALVRNCAPIPPRETIELLHGETIKPSKLRKALQRTVESDVLASSAGPLVWALWSTKELYEAFGGGGDGTTARDYLSYLESQSPQLFGRDRTLAVRFFDPSDSRVENREQVGAWLTSEYDALSNHGFIALIVDTSSHPDRAWALINDATLFGERFREVRLKQMYFRHEEVRRQTCQHISGIDLSAAQFDILNEGYTYRDVFVLTGHDGNVIRLALVMQKNARDETRVPCPACRSLNIEGNSYPTFGVRSWECRNVLCPNRSIYNRGNRFQFRSIVQQAAIEDPRNTISVDNVNRWRRDVLSFESDAEIAATLIRHYSIADDGVAVIGLGLCASLDSLGRRVSSSMLPASATNDFWKSSFFRRFLVQQVDRQPLAARTVHLDAPYEMIEGDSTEELTYFADDTFDRAITSPPYFNAREYAQWSNLYCYLHDMFLNASQVYRTLKPGGLYAYNIFDYFDNERVVTFSAMGQKRIPLGALMAHVFEEIGFELVGVIPWDKGEIHGKRGFNGGNYSPYYQSPFNCWEHILIGRKPVVREYPPHDLPAPILTHTAQIAPVFKMVRGENVYGHTAPFPEAIPDLLLAGLPVGAVVLDPYAGSGTTARAAISRGIKAVLIERDAEYASLSRKMIDERVTDLRGSLF